MAQHPRRILVNMGLEQHKCTAIVVQSNHVAFWPKLPEWESTTYVCAARQPVRCPVCVCNHSYNTHSLLFLQSGTLVHSQPIVVHSPCPHPLPLPPNLPAAAHLRLTLSLNMSSLMTCWHTQGVHHTSHIALALIFFLCCQVEPSTNFKCTHQR
jgi:hypothetical protein